MSMDRQPRVRKGVREVRVAVLQRGDNSGGSSPTRHAWTVIFMLLTLTQPMILRSGVH